jgi:O-antigen ligase
MRRARRMPQRGQRVSRGLNSQSTLFDLRIGLRVLGALASFEAVFTFFLISVNYKSDPRFSWVPIDPTIIFFVLGVAMGALIIYREGMYLPGLTVVSLLILFIAWVLLTDLWTPSELYAREKLFKLATLNLWSVIATAMIMANRRERVRRFLMLVLVLGTAASLDGIFRYIGVASYDTAVEPFSPDITLSASFRLENYTALGRFFGMGAVVAFAAWLQTSPFSKRGVALMAAFVICFYGLLISAGRGPTFATVAAMLLPLVLGLRITERRLFASKAFVASFVLFVAMAAVLSQVAASYSESLPTLQRFGILLTKEAGGQGQRLGFWIEAWHLWLQQPLFGSGVGSWPVLSSGLDVRRYPHNLILEVLVEFGLIGLFLLVAAAVAAVRRASVRRLRSDPLLMCAAMLWMSLLISAMTSSDIIGNRNLFAILGLLVMRPYGRTSHIETESRAGDLGPTGRSHSYVPQGIPNPGGQQHMASAPRAARWH